MRNLKPGGMILIREGKLFFASPQALREIAGEHGLAFEIMDQNRRTSDKFFVLRNSIKVN